MEFDDDALERTLDAFSDRAPPLKITSLSPNIATGRAYRPRPPPEPAQSSAATRIEDAGAACASQHRSTRRLGEVARSAAQRVFRDTKHGLAVRIPTRTALARGHEPDKTPRKPCSSRQTHSDSAGLRSRWSEVRILWGALKLSRIRDRKSGRNLLLLLLLLESSFGPRLVPAKNGGGRSRAPRTATADGVKRNKAARTRARTCTPAPSSAAPRRAAPPSPRRRARRRRVPLTLRSARRSNTSWANFNEELSVSSVHSIHLSGLECD